MKQTYMKKVLFLIPLAFLISCNPMIKLVFNVREAKKIESRYEADSLNNRIIRKFDVDYLMLYRTDNYLYHTKDTSFWSGEVKYFSDNHVLYNQHTNYCSSLSYKDINPDSLLVPIIDESVDSLKTIDKYLIGLEYLSGESFEIDSIDLRKYNVVMDFNTWWRGPEKRRLRRIRKNTTKDSILFIFINKDYIVADSLMLYEYVFGDTTNADKDRR